MEGNSMAGSGLIVSNEQVQSLSFLDFLRGGIHDWTVSLFDSETGGFRQSAQIGVNIMTSTDVAWMRYAASDPDIGAPDRERFIGYLARAQDPATGMVRHDRGPAGQGHCDGHAFWQTARALGILGGQLKRFPVHLAQVLTPSGLDAWFRGFDWTASGNGNHHEVLGLVPVLAGMNNPEWTDVFYQNIGSQQDDASGCWPQGGAINISRTFAYTALHMAGGRLPRRPEKILCAMLTMQTENGIWDNGMPGFHTMDAIFLLARLPGLINSREKEARDALRLTADRIRDIFAAFQPQLMDNPHKMLAMTHGLGLLQETFPEKFPSSIPFRFDWDRMEFYKHRVIQEAAAS